MSKTRMIILVSILYVGVEAYSQSWNNLERTGNTENLLLTLAKNQIKEFSMLLKNVI